MGENRFIAAGGLGGVAGAVVYLLGDNLFITILIGVAIFVIFLFILKPTPVQPGPAEEPSLDAVLGEGEEALKAIAAKAGALEDGEVRREADEICETVRRVLETLREKPENIPGVRKFFNYYLPTLRRLLTSYESIEKSGVPRAGIRAKLLGHLKSIGSAMGKLHENLYQKDVLDMTVEMQVMTTSCIQDGLLTWEDFNFQNAGLEKKGVAE